MKAIQRKKFSIPVEGGAHPPIAGRLIIIPDGSKPPRRRSEKFEITVTRKQMARALRNWRTEDPVARRVPHWLVPAAIVKRCIERALEVDKAKLSKA